MCKLLEEIQGTAAHLQHVGARFATESDEIRTQAAGLVMGAHETGKYLHGDELIAEVTMAVPVEKVIERIKELHAKHYKGGSVSTTDITNVKQYVQPRCDRSHRFRRAARAVPLTGRHDRWV